MDFQENIEIDLIDLCKYILKRWRLLVCGIIIGALISGIVSSVSLNKYYAAIRATSETGKEDRGIQESKTDTEDIAINVEALNQTDVDDINRAIDLFNTYKKILDSKGAYYRNSILFSMDSIHVPILEKRYLISDEQDTKFSEESESNIKNIISLYNNALLSNNTIEKIKTKLGWSCENHAIQDLISVETAGDSIMKVIVTAPTENDCDEIMSVLDGEIEEQTDIIGRNISFSVSYMGDSYSEDYSESMVIKQKEILDSIIAMEKTIIGIEGVLSEEQKSIYRNAISSSDGEIKKVSLEEAQSEQMAIEKQKALAAAQASASQATTVAPVTTVITEIKKPSVKKYLLLGTFGGLFAVSFILALFYVMNGKLKVSEDIKTAFGCQVLEEISREVKYKNNLGGRIDSALYKAFYKKMTYDEAISLAMAKIRLTIKSQNCNKLLVTNTYATEHGDNVIADLIRKVKGAHENNTDFSVEYIDQVISNVNEIEKLNNMDCAVIIEKIGSSNFVDINKEIELLRKNNIKILGAVVVR